MIIIPAIDILKGEVVRLDKGEYDHVTGYEQTPANYARAWQQAGAECIHLVDLDAAKEGKLINLEFVCAVRQAVKVQLEYGGGVRSFEAADMLLGSGIDRVILGTAAFDDEVLLPLLEQYGDRIAVSVDAKGGFVKVAGWVEDSGRPFIDVCRELEKKGVSTIVFTDIDRDGMLKGPNWQALEQVLASTNMKVISSGGISSLDDVRRLCAMKRYPNLFGAITGKALYEKKLDLAEAIRVTKGGC